ncbi:MAG: bifunctional UDP-N-acetylglucosamine diphosphorylase/glucosamine-1-phosphate N-acetyltransferase GlmU [Enterobacteriaceae bacterium]
MSIFKFSIVILAAGKGKRMLTSIPKSFFPVYGKPMIQYILNTLKKIKTDNVYIVYNSDCENIKNSLNLHGIKVKWILQKFPLGTGDAIKQVIPYAYKDKHLLILLGDMPLIKKKTIKNLIKKYKLKRNFTIVTAFLKNPTGYGRIIRKNEKIIKIIEESNITSDKYLKIKEVNSGIFFINKKILIYLIKKIKKDKKTKEIYITKILNYAYKKDIKVTSLMVRNKSEIININNKLQLFVVEKIIRKNKIIKLLSSGVNIYNVSRIEIYGDVTHGKDLTIEPDVVLKGKIFLGNNVKIKNGSILENVHIEDNVTIYPYSYIKNTKIMSNSKIGPFAVILKSKIKKNTKIGSFVEIKNTSFGDFSKAKHLSYLGDSEVGKKVNIGAGVIVCNYDGMYKHKTIIGDNVFIGADTQIIAPLRITKDATIGAGSTITKNVLSNGLTISRVKQFSIKNWKRVKK